MLARNRYFLGQDTHQHQISISHDDVMRNELRNARNLESRLAFTRIIAWQKVGYVDGDNSLEFSINYKTAD